MTPSGQTDSLAEPLPSNAASGFHIVVHSQFTFLNLVLCVPTVTILLQR